MAVAIAAALLAACHTTESATFHLPNARALIVVRESAHPFLAEYDRTVQLTANGQSIAVLAAFPDTGGYGRMNLYSVRGRYSLAGPFESFTLDPVALRLFPDQPFASTAERMFIGAFDEDAAHRWRFIPASERRELDIVPHE